MAHSMKAMPDRYFQSLPALFRGRRIVFLEIICPSIKYDPYRNIIRTMIQILVKKYLSSPFTMCVTIALLSASALLFAYYMQYVKGLDPCHLCLLQRWPYRLTCFLGLIGAVMAKTGRIKPSAIVLAICSACFLGESGLAFYHAGVEQHWWKSIFESCTFSFNAGGDLLSQIEHKPAARCDEIAWSLFGISMAGYNVFFSLFLSGLCAAGAIFSAPRQER